MSLTCVIDFKEELAVVKPRGEVDMNTSSLLRDAVEAAMGQPGMTWIDMDLGDVTFLDSTGIAVLVALHKSASSNGITLRVLRPHPIVRTLLEVVGLLDLLIAGGEIPQRQPVRASALLS